MSKKLHEDAVDVAIVAAHGRSMAAIQRETIRLYLAHLSAHGIKLTPREPTGAMYEAAGQYASPDDYDTDSRGEETWRARFRIQWKDAHDAADWPGDAP